MRAIGALLVGAMLLLSVPVAAQTGPLVPGDSCFEVDHSGSNPFGSPSLVRVFLTVPPGSAGDWLDLSGDGASGPISGAGQVGPDGVAIVDMPLYSYGDHTITEGILDSGGDDILLETTGLDFVIDSSEPTCNPDDLILVTADTTTTTSTSTTVPVTPETTTTSMAVTETTTVTTIAVTTGTTEVVTSGGDEDPTRGFPWIPVGLGTILIVGGYVVYRGHKDPCEEELAAWLAAQAACDRARATADAARSACDEAQAWVESLEQEKKDICKAWPPACWGSEDGGWIQNAGDPSSRITQRDLHMRRMALGEIWDKYESGDMSAQEVEDAWKEANTPEFREGLREKDAQARADLELVESKLAEAKRKAKEACDKAAAAKADADAACAKAAAAKAAYDACMGAAAAAAAAPPSSTEGGEDGPGTGEPPGTGGGGTPPEEPPSEPPPSRPEDEEKEEPVCCPDGVWVGYGWSVGGSLLFGWETSVVNFICLCDTAKYVDMMSKSVRAGIMLGGETSGFLALMWGAPHAENVPLIWADKSASGWDGDISLGPSISKGIKSVVKDVGTGAGWDYLKWAAKNKVPVSNLDPRRIKELAPSVGSIVGGSVKDQVLGQGMDPQLIIVPFGAGVQVGVWRKWCMWVKVRGYASCGCYPPDYPL